MDYKIVIYKQSTKSKSVQLSRALNGYADYSNKGKYKYLRKGLLKKIPVWNPVKGVFILKEEDVGKVLELFERYNVTYYCWTVTLRHADACQVKRSDE